MLNGSLSKLEVTAFFHNVHIKSVKSFYLVAFIYLFTAGGQHYLQRTDSQKTYTFSINT